MSIAALAGGSPVLETITLEGTVSPKPTIFIVIDKPSSLESIMIKNKTTQQGIEITGDFVSGDIVKIDTENLKVTVEGNEREFVGVMPEFDIGNNRLEIFGKDESALVDFNEKHNRQLAITKGNEYGIFLTTSVTGDDKYGHFEFLISKNADATGRMIVRLYDDTDGGGIPESLLQTKYVDFDLINEGLSWVSIDFDDFNFDDLNGSTGGFAVTLEPEDGVSVITMAYRDFNTLEKMTFRLKTETIFTVQTTREPVYRSYKKVATSYWQLDVSAKYTKRYL